MPSSQRGRRNKRNRGSSRDEGEQEKIRKHRLYQSGTGDVQMVSRCLPEASTTPLCRICTFMYICPSLTHHVFLGMVIGIRSNP